jgi:amino acid adenylation domain-containing protein
MLTDRERLPLREDTVHGGPDASPFPRVVPSRGSPEAGLLHEMFELRAAERPAAPAVIVGREVTSYAGLDRYANRVARHLWGLGVRPGARVGILLSHSMDAYAAMLGVLKAGAACVPIDPGDPPGHAARALEDSGASVLVTTEEHAHLCARFRGHVLDLDRRRAAIAAEYPARLPWSAARPAPGDLCHVFYPADAAGRTRGVMVEHRSAAHLVRTGGRLFAIRPWDRVYQGSALSACASLHETWLALHAGAALVPRIPGPSRAALARLLWRARVTVLPCSPDLLSALPRDIPSLRLLILGGGACPEGLVARWSRPGRRLVSTYGHAETAMIATFADLTPERPVTAGQPLPGCRVYVLDDDLRLARYGHVGEICVGGAGVARGYLGLPADTRARFVRDPYAPEGAAEPRLYLTGDLGRINATGELELHGPAPRARGWPPFHGA